MGPAIRLHIPHLAQGPHGNACREGMGTDGPAPLALGREPFRTVDAPAGGHGHDAAHLRGSAPPHRRHHDDPVPQGLDARLLPDRPQEARAERFRLGPAPPGRRRLQGYVDALQVLLHHTHDVALPPRLPPLRRRGRAERPPGDRLRVPAPARHGLDHRLGHRGVARDAAPPRRGRGQPLAGLLDLLGAGLEPNWRHDGRMAALDAPVPEALPEAEAAKGGGGNVGPPLGLGKQRAQREGAA
mmetsp:Transcript_128417/g.363407  ORF Transcript_128417/g.363407 Transcript_128417/m.363407 type:complete len:242 (-) Transcript_128417:1553-2278(-)